MAKKQKKKPDNSITENRKARFNYEIVDTFEAGIVLVGSEVKALREGKGNLDECYGVFDKNGELYLMNSYIGEYSHTSMLPHDARRSRKLLLKRSELRELKMSREREGMTLIPLRLYWKAGKVKVALGVCKGKKQHDKRETSKDRDWQRSRHRLLKQGV